MTTLADIREARGVVAELAAANPILQPVFERLDREYRAAKEDGVDRVARRARDARELI